MHARKMGFLLISTLNAFAFITHVYTTEAVVFLAGDWSTVIRLFCKMPYDGRLKTLPDMTEKLLTVTKNSNTNKHTTIFDVQAEFALLGFHFL